MKVVGQLPEQRPTPRQYIPAIDIYDYPVSPREAVYALYRREPVWQLLGNEIKFFTPRINPEIVARGGVHDAVPFNPRVDAGGKDMFGVTWVYDALNGGGMVVPGSPLLDDANDWPEVIKFPDIDSWNWEESAAANNGTYLTEAVFNSAMLYSGWFERLISFMDFEGAALALVDDEQSDAVKALFDELSTWYIDLIDHYAHYYEPLDGFCIHDDWGSSQNAFFSPDICAEFIVPAMRRVTDHIHSLGLYAELHSCGCNEKQVPNMIAAGWDLWRPQAPVNDVPMLYELYGDKIILAMSPEMYDVEHTTEDEQRALARAYADAYCRPDKPSVFQFHYGGGEHLTPAFREELYRRSRINYCG